LTEKGAARSVIATLTKLSRNACKEAI
jgi:hypothetical protein